ncbi:MAG: quinohemoprotein amine dehydrogenase subunit alpha [Ramlibacter sp.]|nr:quinohemoprotein amine dehydrogenase subunit alpha [Ramlibacter sp.]
MNQVVDHGVRDRKVWRVTGPALLLAAHMFVGAGGALAAAPALLVQKCGACHPGKEKLERLSNIRKSPEGWDMTIVRMGIWHKVQVTREERKVLVKYLADTQGLAPQESAPYRALLERQPNIADIVPSDELGQMCARCHSFGRVALQRRDTQEWRKLVHTHVGQFPSVEYSALGRDRNWLDLALGDTSSKLGELYPYDTAAWAKWRRASHRAPTGHWRVAGWRPGVGAYSGYLRVGALKAGRYAAAYDLVYDNGNRLVGEGESVVYAGYEWRGSALIGNQETRSVFALSADGATMSGRWFMRGADEVGARFEAVRMDSVRPGTIVAVSPALVKSGESTTLRVSGVKLRTAQLERLDLGSDVRVEKVEGVSEDEALVTVKVAQGAATGWRKLGPGPAGADARLAVYRQFDSIRVEPEFAMARLAGGANAALTAQFEAVAYLNGPDGKPGTGDDLRLGPVNAHWSVDNNDEKAKAANDVAFAGVMEPTGRFLPALAGPNPARGGQSNVGDLAVTASVQDGSQTLSGKARMVVGAQRWNTPPLR